MPVRAERVDAWIPTQAPVTSDTPPRGFVEPLLRLAGPPRFLVLVVDPLLRRLKE